jgi:uracil-DNA glycosylase
MGWDARQVRMLEEMGVRLWLKPQDHSHLDGMNLELPPGPPSGRGGGEAGASQAQTAVGSPSADAAIHARSDRGDIESMEWPALRAAVAGCTACALCESRRQTVFGVGHERAHWMVVGEAPGEQEDQQGEPFVGKAGQLLDQMLRAVGLTRAVPAGDDGAPAADPARQAFIANVLKCRPPMNRNPLPEEVARCEPFLRRQVALVQPRLILALGRFAVQSLLRTDEPIGRLRGRVHRYQGVPVVVSYHPAYLLRQPADKARAWDDLCLACEVMDASIPLVTPTP